MSVNLNNMNETEFNNHLISELYSSLAKFREMFKLPKLYPDDVAENAIKDFLIPEIRQNNSLDTILKDKEFCGKISHNFEISKVYPPKNNELNNEIKFTNFMRLFEEQFTSGKSELLTQDCSTHIGIGFCADNSNNYTIRAVISQKGISIESAQLLKDGVVIQGQMLQPNIYLFGIVLSKNKKIAPLLAGPSKINFDKNSGKFNIVLASKIYGTPVALGMRKVSFHCKQTNNVNDIPYLDTNFDDKKITWESYEVLLVQTFNFMKIKDNKKEAIDKFIKPFEDNISTNNKNTNINDVNNIQQNNNVNNLIGNDNISPINQNNNNNNLSANQNNTNQNNNHLSNFKNNLSNVLNSTNSKNPTNSFFNPNFLNNKKPGNAGMQMFGAIQEENSFMIGSVCNSNLNSLRKLNNNLAQLSNAKMNPFNAHFQDITKTKNLSMENAMINNNNNNMMTNNQSLKNNNNNNNVNNNLLNSNPMNKHQPISDINMNQNITNFPNGVLNSNNNINNQNQNASAMNMNSLQNNIKNINMSSLNNFNLNNNNNNLNFSNQNINNNLVRNSLNQNPINQGVNNLSNNLQTNNNNFNMNNNLNRSNFNPINSLSNNNNINNNFNMNSNLNNINQNLNQNQFNNLNNQQQNLNTLNNNNLQMNPNNNLNFEAINNQRQGNLMTLSNNNNNHFCNTNNLNNNFSFNNNNNNNNNNNSNAYNQNIMNMSNSHCNRGFNNFKSAYDILFLQVTHYEKLFRNEKQIIKAYNIPHMKFGPNPSISEMLNALPNSEDDVLHVNIKKTLAAGHEKFVITLDPFKTNNLIIRAKSRNELADFIQSKINEKKLRLLNNLNNNNQFNNEHLANNNNLIFNENERNNNKFNDNYASKNNPFTLFEKNANLNNSISNQQHANIRYNQNESFNKFSTNYLNNQNNDLINNNYVDSNKINTNKAFNYVDNPNSRMFNNAHPNLLKSSVKFYQRETNAIEDFYANSSLDRLYNYDNMIMPQKENDRANLNNLHNANKLNKLNNNNSNYNNFLISKEEYQKLNKSLFSNECNNNLNPINKDLSNNDCHNSIKDGKFNLDKLAKEYLEESDLKQEPNPVFVQLYKSQTDFDLILDINGKRINAHKLVVFTQSNAIKTISLLGNTNYNNVNLNRNSNFNEPVLIHLDKKLKHDIFKHLLKFLYCRKISQDIINDVMALREMLLTANNLEIFDLQRILIIKYIIPSINKDCCLRFMKDSHNLNVSSEISEVWKLLGQYSLIISAKNLSYLIKHSRNQILGMETDLLFALIEESIYFASEFSEVQNIIELVIESGFANDVFELLNNLSKYYENARNFHVQNIDIKEVINKIDCLQPIELPLLNDEKILSEKFQEYKTTNNNLAANSNLTNFNANGNVTDNLNDKNKNLATKERIGEIFNINSNNNQLNKVNQNEVNLNENIIFNKHGQAISTNTHNNDNLELAKNKNEFSNLINNFLKNDKYNCPSYNKVNPANENLRKKKPNFTFRLNLSEELLENCSIISDAFNTKSNSWQIKIDVQKETGDVSLFLVERGLPVLLQKNFYEIKKKNTTRFTSVLFDIEVKDNSFEKSFVMFFSFLLNQNQVIGFENFFNLNQLDKKEQIFINVWIKEYALHSACLQYISNNFQNLVNNSINLNNNNDNNININNNKSNEFNNLLIPNNRDRINKNNLNASDRNKNLIGNINQNNNINFTLNKTFSNGNGAIRTLFDVSIGDLACILFNDNLNVENENFVLSFIYKYCLKRNPKEIECLMNTIRYKFVDFRMLCIIARDHKVISKSFTLRKFFDYELKCRLGKRVDFNGSDIIHQTEKLSEQLQNKKSQSLGGQENYLNLSMHKKINSMKNPFDQYAKQTEKPNINKQNLLFSDLKDSPFINNLSNNNNKNDIENSEIQNNFLNIDLKNIELIQSKPRLNYKTLRTNHPIEIELGKFFFESNHHLGYEEEIEKLKKLLEETAKAKEREIKLLQNQKKELEADIQKINEREMRRRKSNNNISSSSLPIFNKQQNQENPKCVIF